MEKGAGLYACAALLVAIIPAGASAREIDCTSSAVSPAQAIEASNSVRDFAREMMLDNIPAPFAERFYAAVKVAADICRARHDWDEQAYTAAFAHELGRQLEIGTLGFGMLSPQALAEFEAKEFGDVIWDTAIKIAFAEYLGSPQEVSMLGEAALEGSLVGIGDEVEWVQLRNLLLARAFQRYGPLAMQALGRQ